MNKRWLIVLAPLLVFGCTSKWDMQGVDPKEHYKKHPVKNKIESKQESYKVIFAGGGNRLSTDQIHEIKARIGGISPESVENVMVGVHKSQLSNAVRKEHLTKLLFTMGYKKKLVMFEPSESVSRNEALLTISHTVAVGPRCPDWRSSPVTTYSNTGFGGLGCANVTNLGLMVVDPRDLEHGSGAVSPDPERNAVVIDGYSANISTGDDSSASSTGASGAIGATTTAQ